MQANTSDMQLALEALADALREAGWWTKESPSQEALNSQEPFCVDCMTFSQWLQWVYIPKMKQYIEANNALPDNSGLTPIAIEAWRGCEDKSRQLLVLVQILDDLSNGENVDGALRSLASFHPSH